jgi:putative membrane protein
MIMAAFFAFLHHVAAFSLVAVLVVEFVLIRGELTVATARKLLVADGVLGASAGVVLAAGLVRVFYFEKGGAYYFHDVPFLAKLALFVIVALISVYPTREFLTWRKAVKERRAPTVSERKIRTLRSLVHWELVGVVLIILCAALMAKGIGYVGR